MEYVNIKQPEMFINIAKIMLSIKDYKIDIISNTLTYIENKTKKYITDIEKTNIETEYIVQYTKFARNEMRDEINHNCKVSIESGFNSNVLGAVYSYNTTEVDQINLSTALITGTDQKLKCKKDNGVYEYIIHTPSQISTLVSEFNVIKTSFLIKALNMKNTLENMDLEQLSEITW